MAKASVAPVATATKTTTEQFLEDFNKELSPELRYKKLLFILPDRIDGILESYFAIYGLHIHIRPARELIMKSITAVMGSGS